MWLKENIIWPLRSGCTGGQHRSVVLAEQTAKILKEEDYNVSVYHRDIALADTERQPPNE